MIKGGSVAPLLAPGPYNLNELTFDVSFIFALYIPCVKVRLQRSK